MLNRFFTYANGDGVLYKLTDRTTGVEISRFTFGKRYQWWILLIVALMGLVVKYFT